MRIARKYQHKIKEIKKYVETDSGLYQYSIELSLAYTHPAYGKTHILNNPNELRKFMIEVIPTDTSIIDIACISTAKNFYEISIDSDAEVIYTNKAGFFREKKMTGQELIRSMMYSEGVETFENMHEDEIFVVSINDLQYVIHYFDINWWRSNLSRLENYFDTQPGTSAKREVDDYNWSSLSYSEECVENNIKRDISTVITNFIDVYNMDGSVKMRTYEQLVEATYNKLSETYNRFGKSNIIVLIKRYVLMNEYVNEYIERNY